MRIKKIFYLLGFLSIVFSTETALSQQYGHWETMDSMEVPRYWFGKSVFTNSKVLVAGSDGFPITNSAEIYDLNNSSWASTVPMQRARAAHYLITLQNGEVIAIGGFLTRSCEIFNPHSISWRYTDSLKTLKSYWDTATLLCDGRVIVTGGQYFDQSTLEYIYYKNCELFDPNAETWSMTDSLTNGRSGHTATLLNDGKLLIAGGQNGGEINSCEIFDPVTNKWSSAGSLLHARSFHSAVLLSDGRVFVSGGITPDSTLGTSNCEIYDPAANSWSEAGEMFMPRSSHETILLFDSTVLITGGSFEPEVWEIYDPNTLSIVYYDTLPIVVFEPEVEMLPDGRVISMGGYTFDGMVLELSNKCLMYTPNITSVNKERYLITGYSLSQNYPNPFNPVTTIEYSIPVSSFVEIKLYDMLGSEIALLVSEEKTVGRYSVNFNAEGLPSGIYFYKLISNNFTDTKKLIVLR